MIQEFIQLVDPDYREKIKEAFNQDPGTYILHWFQNGKPRKIQRLLATDHEGVLYIGKTDGPLHIRVGRELKDSILSNSDHFQKIPLIKGYNTLALKFYRVRKCIKVEDLYLKISNKINESPEKDESRMLEEYVRDHGELPPFNGNYGSQVMWELYY